MEDNPNISVKTNADANEKDKEERIFIPNRMVSESECLGGC